jgi:hypothetical protein
MLTESSPALIIPGPQFLGRVGVLLGDHSGHDPDRTTHLSWLLPSSEEEKAVVLEKSH